MLVTTFHASTSPCQIDHPLEEADGEEGAQLV